MSRELVVHKKRTNRLTVNLGIDISGDTFSSEIREEVDPTSPLLATWTVEFLTNGLDGKLVLTILSAQLTNVSKNYGYMDIKRVSAGEPMSVLRDPIKVKFQGVVTA